MRTVIYIWSDLKKNEFIYTGIEFHEFLSGLTNKIEHLILLKGNFLGNDFVNNFELLDGKEQIDLLLQENIYAFGDFSFVDYVPGTVELMKKADIAELLYLAHMLEPIQSPFSHVIQNRFAYLAHDDGFFCKLYAKNNNDIADVLFHKILNYINERGGNVVSGYTENTKQALLNISEEGLLVDLDTIDMVGNDISLKFYLIGRYDNMDDIYNNIDNIKQSACTTGNIKYINKEWLIN